MRNAKRPVDFGPLHMRLPLGAWVSILHRVSGILLVLLLPVLLYLFERSLGDAESFARLQAGAASPAGKAALVLAAAVFVLHFYAGLRHLLLDLELGIERQPARRSAGWVLAATLITVIALAGGSL